MNNSVISIQYLLCDQEVIQLFPI